MRVIDAVKETIDDVSSTSPSSERRASARNVSYCLLHGVYYPHQHTVDTPEENGRLNWDLLVDVAVLFWYGHGFLPRSSNYNRVQMWDIAPQLLPAQERPRAFSSFKRAMSTGRDR